MGTLERAFLRMAEFLPFEQQLFLIEKGIEIRFVAVSFGYNLAPQKKTIYSIPFWNAKLFYQRGILLDSKATNDRLLCHFPPRKISSYKNYER
jgi:hypothetical protein